MENSEKAVERVFPHFLSSIQASTCVFWVTLMWGCCSGHWKWSIGQDRAGSYLRQKKQQTQTKTLTELRTSDSLPAAKLRVVQPWCIFKKALQESSQAGAESRVAWEGQLARQRSTWVTVYSIQACFFLICLLLPSTHTGVLTSMQMAAKQEVWLDYTACQESLVHQGRAETRGRDNWGLFPEPKSWHQVCWRKHKLKPFF